MTASLREVHGSPLHAVVHQRTRSGVDRREFILLLTKGKEHRTVTTIAVDGR
jgi:hypothetical protein